MAAQDAPCCLCKQVYPVCNRARREVDSFSLRTTMDSFEDGVIYIGYFFPGNYMIVKGGNPNFSTKHFIWIDRTVRRTMLCGAHWRSLYEAYGITIGDNLFFRYDHGLNVLSFEDFNENDINKPFLEFPECEEVPNIWVDALLNTYFTDAMEISQGKINVIFACLEEYVNEAATEVCDDDFFLFVRKLDSDEMYNLEIPIEVYGDGRSITLTQTTLYGYGQQVYCGRFKHKYGEAIKFKDGWSDFRCFFKFYEGSIMIAKMRFSPNNCK